MNTRLMVLATAAFVVVTVGACSSSTGPSVEAASSTGPAATSSPPAAVESVPLPSLASRSEAAVGAPAGSIRVALAGPPGHFEPATLAATAGDIVFFLDNTSPGTHSFAIGPALGKLLAASRTVMSGDAEALTVRGVPPGSYITWCTISNHAAEGMVGTLLVSP